MAPPSATCSSSTNMWQRKLRFFTRIKRFLQSKTANPLTMNTKPSISIPDDIDDHDQLQEDLVVEVEEAEEEEEDSSVIMRLQKAVKRLHFGGPKLKEMAAMEIYRLAKQDFKLKKLMAIDLGVIPPLVAMAASDVAGRRLAAVTALIELATGTYTNKALMVEAGILEKLPKIIDETVDEQTRHGFSELVLSLSSLNYNNSRHVAALNPSHVLPFTLAILDSDSNPDTKDSCLATLFNFSTVLDNAANLGSDKHVVDSLLNVVVSSSPNKTLSEKALATLGNIVVTLPGKKSLENSASVPQGLIEVLTWGDFPKAQELAAYVLMVLAHQSSGQRAKMAAAGIVPVLLEVALLAGSTLAQKRAMKLLQWFRDERVGSSHSGPQASIGSSPVMEGQDGNKRVMQRLVKDSLKKNMEMITKRAALLDTSHSSSKLKSVLVISTSSKSLPY